MTMVLLLDVVINVGCEVDEVLVVEEVSGRRVVCGSEVISGLDVWVEGNSDVLNVVASSDVVVSSPAYIHNNMYGTDTTTVMLNF